MDVFATFDDHRRRHHHSGASAIPGKVGEPAPARALAFSTPTSASETCSRADAGRALALALRRPRLGPREPKNDDRRQSGAFSSSTPTSTPLASILIKRTTNGLGEALGFAKSDGNFIIASTCSDQLAWRRGQWPT